MGSGLPSCDRVVMKVYLFVVVMGGDCLSYGGGDCGCDGDCGE